MGNALVIVANSAVAAAKVRIARAHGGTVLVAPPSVARDIGALDLKRYWVEAPGSGDRRAAGARGSLSNDVFEALRLAATPFDEIRFDARSGAGAVVCTEAKSGGLRLGARLVVELEPGDETLGAPRVLGESIEDRLALATVRVALRDCDAVEGDELAKSSLQAAGWELARVSPTPAWPAEDPPGVTAVVTYYNLGEWLPACIASLRAQTVPVEIIIIDDGSRPEQSAIADAEAARDPSIRVVHQANAGLPAARNRGAAEASHELVTMVDADNTMRPRLVERLRDALRVRPEASWACPAFHSFDDATGKTVFNFGPAEFCEDVALLRNVVGDGCALYRKSALDAVGGFGLDYTYHPDWHFWLRAFEAGLSGAAVPEILFDYRERSDSMLRAMTPLSGIFSRTELVRFHPRLLAKYAQELSRLQAAEVLAEYAHQRWLGKTARDAEVALLHGDVAALREDGLRLEVELRESRTAAELIASRARELERELPELRDYAKNLETQLGEARRYVGVLEEKNVQAEKSLAASHLQANSALAAAAHKLESTQAKLEGTQAKLDSSRAECDLTQLKLLAALQRANAAELATNDSEIAKNQALADLAEMSRSGAVRASRLLSATNPTAHRAAGELINALLRLTGRR